MGGGGSTCTVAGYWYNAGIHMVFCQSLDELLSIVVDKKIIWTSGVEYTGEEWVYQEGVGWVLDLITYPGTGISSNRILYINKKDIFGGEDGSGGIQGNVSVEFGEVGQSKNAYLVGVLGNDIAAHRGVFGLVLQHMTLTCNTSQIKPWEIRGKRTKFGWEDASSEIDEDMNPSHILYECLTDTSWGGLGYSSATVDEGSFITAAGILSGEGLGISMLWDQDISLDDFMKNILAHVNGTMFQSYKTGLFTLRLIRCDYEGPGGMPILDEASIISLENFETKATSETINTVTVKFTNRTNDSEDSVTVSDLAHITSSGRVINATKNFYGFTKASVASKVASRELLQLSVPLSKITVIVNRTQYGLEPGDTFVFNWSKLGITNHIMRVTAIDLGTLENNVIRIDATTDIFGFDQTIVSPPPVSSWIDPATDAIELTDIRVEELSYYQAVREVYKTDDPVLLAGIADTDTLFHGIAAAPSIVYIDYELWDQLGTSEYVRRAVGNFSKKYVLTASVNAEVYSWFELGIILSAALPIGEYYGRYGYIEDEIVQIVNINEAMNQIQVARGVMDTVPVYHAIDTTVQLIDWMFSAKDKKVYTQTEEIDFKFLPSTSNGRLPLLSCDTIIAKVAGARMNKPLPPGNVLFNDQSYPLLSGLIVYSDTLDANQDFTNIDGVLPDLNIWDVVIDTNGVIEINNNKLFMSLDTDASGELSSLISKFQVSNDFNIQISFSDFNSGDYIATEGLSFVFWIDANNYAVVKIQGGTYGFYSNIVRGGVESETSAARDETYGHLRIQRIADTLRIYAKNGPDVEFLFQSLPSFYLGSGVIQILLESPASRALMSSNIDDLIIHSGDIFWFDNVSFEYKFWDGDTASNMFVVDTAYPIVNNKLFIDITNNVLAHVVCKSNFKISGDFDIQVPFSEFTLEVYSYFGIHIKDSSGGILELYMETTGPQQYAFNRYGTLGYLQIGTLINTHTEGVFRLTRIGDFYQAFIYDAGWVEIGSGLTVTGMEDIVDVEFEIYTSSTSVCMTTNYDSILIVSGNIIPASGGVISWSHRDRLTQTLDVFPQDYGDIGPEENTLYNVRLYNSAEILIYNINNLPATKIAVALIPMTNNIRFEVESIRDSKVSHQYQNVAIELCGYGITYGNYYGGTF